MLARTLLVFLFCLFSTWALAADQVSPPAGGKADGPAAGSKSEDFVKINKEWTDLIANLGALKSEYATSTDAARKAAIRKQYTDGVEKATAMEGTLIAAAERAFAESPNADPKITEVLYSTLGERVGREDYEAAFQLGKTLMDNKCTNKYVPAFAGVAAYCVNEYDLADRWLKTAQASGALSEISNQMHRDYAHYPGHDR